MPQIELMQSDLPHTLYKRRNDKKKGKVEVDDEALRLQEEANAKARKRRESQQPPTLEELFEGAAEED